MWQADIVRAARFHPLGPILFIGTLVAVGLLTLGLASGRSWRLDVTPVMRKVAISLVLAAFAVSWTLKLVWLGN
jgi:hypothetical protein